MDGLYLNKRDSYLEKVSKNTEELMLIAKGDGMEVMIQNIKPDEIFCLSPGDDAELMEFFYIIEGAVEERDVENGRILTAGDYFYLHGLSDSVYFTTIGAVTMLYMSTRPVFHLLSDEISDLVTISAAVKAKDIYTYDHDDRLRQYALKIGEKIQLSKERLEKLLFAALYHDLGKINTPSEILNKPGPLSAEEFECVRRHSTDGRLLVEKTYLKDIGEIIEQHHERLDGSGYPHGLKADEILLEAKIIGIVDSYDALTTNRSYHPSISGVEAMVILKAVAGITLDATLVDIFEGILKEEGKL